MVPKAGMVSDVLDRRLVAVSPNTSLEAARRLSATSNVDLLPVLLDGRLVGIVLKEDLDRHAAASKVSEIMKKPVFVLRDADLNEARKLVISHNLSRIPVVDSRFGMMCIGTVSSTALV